MKTQITKKKKTLTIKKSKRETPAEEAHVEETPAPVGEAGPAPEPEAAPEQLARLHP